MTIQSTGYLTLKQAAAPISQQPLLITPTKPRIPQVLDQVSLYTRLLVSNKPSWASFPQPSLHRNFYRTIRRKRSPSNRCEWLKISNRYLPRYMSGNDPEPIIVSRYTYTSASRFVNTDKARANTRAYIPPRSYPSTVSLRSPDVTARKNSSECVGRWRHHTSS